MRATSPIRDLEDIQKLLSVKGRDGFLFATGLYTALRVSEYREATWGWFVDQGVPRMNKSFEIKKKRSSTGKYRVIPFCPEFRQRIREYYDDCGQPNPDVHVFRSKRRRGPISTKGINDLIIKPWMSKLGIETANPSSHTLRKTMARQFYLKHGLAMTMKMLGHTSESVTLRYIGIEEDDMADAHGRFSYAEPRLIDKIKSGSIHYNGFLFVTRMYNDLEFKKAVSDYVDFLGGRGPDKIEATRFLFSKRHVSSNVVSI